MSINAFEPIVVSTNLFGDKTKVQAESIEVSDECMWVGSSDGFIRIFQLQPEVQGETLTALRPRLITQQQIRPKPIQKLMIIPPLRLLLVLVDGRLVLLNAMDLSEVESKFLKKVDSVRLFSRDLGINLMSARTVEVSYACSRKGVAHMEVFYDDGEKKHEVRAHDSFKPMELPSKTTEVLALSRDRLTLCVALQAAGSKVRYGLYQMDTRSWIELPECDAAPTPPLVLRVGPGEFLVTITTDVLTIGLFSTAKGATTRRQLEWVDAPAHVAFRNPFIVAYCPTVGNKPYFVVHSILDQQQKQAIPCEPMRGMNDTSGNIMSFSALGTTLLSAISLEIQIAQLLKDARSVNEALQLAHVAFGRMDGADGAVRRMKYATVLRSAGVQQLKAGHFADGLESFFKAGVGPRTVLALFPHLQMRVPPRDDTLAPDQVTALLAAIKTMMEDTGKRTAANRALEQYLMRCRGEPQLLDIVDSALAVVYAQTSPPKLVELLSNTNRCSAPDCAAALQAAGCHHALAMLLMQAKTFDRALDIWKGLELGQLKDSTYPGIAHVVEVLRLLSEPALVCAHVADWVLARYPKAVTIFTRRRPEERAGLLRPDDVITALRASPDAIEAYLEHLVYEAKVEDERLHTRLALCYLDHIASDPAANEVRWKLCTFLQQSGSYDIETVLKHIEKTDMLMERAILHGKLNQHVRAFEILVLHMKDLEAAERYSIEFAKSMDHAGRCRMYQAWLAVYMASGDPAHIPHALALLNSTRTEMDLAEVLRILPDTWTVGAVHAFLRRSLHHGIHTARTAHIQRGLSKVHSIATAGQYWRRAGKAFVVTEDTRCQVCDGKLMESPLAWFPNGVVVHDRCQKDPSICPVTRRDFSKDA